MDSAAERASVHATLLAEGVELLVRRTTSPTVNIATGAASGGGSLDIPSCGLLSQYRLKDIDGTTIRRGDMRMMLSAESFVDTGTRPMAGDVVEVAGEVWNVIHVSALAPAGVALLYWLQLRK